jgi:hypothetical protein
LDDDKAYDPGVRIYLDNHRIINDGLATRDGIHTMKVRLALPLSRCMVSVVKFSDLELPEAAGFWTPRSFTVSADRLFWNGRA